jgi:hypothetical protein
LAATKAVPDPDLKIDAPVPDYVRDYERARLSE